jgi:hypothetical protein
MFATSLQGVSASTSQNAAQSVESFIDKKKYVVHKTYQTYGFQKLKGD